MIVKSGIEEVQQIKRMIQNLIIDLDEKLILNKHFQSGSTLTGILVYRNYLYTINLGDSRTFVVANPNLQLDGVWITEDHVPYSQSELRRIRSVGSYVSDAKPGDVPRIAGMYSLSRAIGDPVLKIGDDNGRRAYLGRKAPMSPVADITTIPLIALPHGFDDESPMYMVAMASDGLFEVESTISNEYIVNYLKNKMKVKMDANQLIEDLDREAKMCVEYAKELGSNDNITILLIPITSRMPGIITG